MHVCVNACEAAGPTPCMVADEDKPKGRLRSCRLKLRPIPTLMMMQAYNNFLDATYLADRKTTVRSWLRQNPSIMEVGGFACLLLLGTWLHMLLCNTLHASMPPWLTLHMFCCSTDVQELPPPELVGRYSG